MSFTPGAGTSYLLSSTAPVPSGTANGVLYLNGSKVVTSGSALTFDGTNFTYQSAISLINNDGSGNRALVTPFAYGGSGATGTLVLSSTYGNANQQRIRVGVGGAAAISFDIDSAEGMRLTSTGLGIGTSSPGTKLDVQSSAAAVASRVKSIWSDATQILDRADASSAASFVLRTAGVDGYSFGQFTGGSNALEFRSGGSTRLILDSSGNLGLGVTPSAWSGVGVALQINRLSFVSGGPSNVDQYMTSNGFWNGAAWAYIGTAAATQYIQNVSGDHRWRIAPSGTAGNAISFTQAMTLDASGNLLIGTTSASDNTATYKQVIFLPSGDVAGGGFMVSSNQSANGGKALISAINYATLTGSFTKPSIYSYSRATAAYAANFQNTGANLIATVEVASDNLSFINKQAYIQHVQINSTTGRYLNNDAYLYVQRNSGTVNVNEYVAYSSSYQTAVGNETIGAFVDFNAAPFRGTSAGSLVTARYGVLIDFAATNVTNPWGVYQSNASVRNYFAGGAIFSGAALATNATNGFVYVPTCAGTPTGTPTTYTGTAPIVIDTTNNKLYFYSGGQWRDAGP